MFLKPFAGKLKRSHLCKKNKSPCTALKISLLTCSRNNKDSEMDQGFLRKYKGWEKWEILLEGT